MHNSETEVHFPDIESVILKAFNRPHFFASWLEYKQYSSIHSINIQYGCKQPELKVRSQQFNLIVRAKTVFTHCSVYTARVCAYFLWKVKGSVKLPACAVTLHPVTHYINTHVYTHKHKATGLRTTVLLLIDRRLTFILASIQYHHCSPLLWLLLLCVLQRKKVAVSEIIKNGLRTVTVKQFFSISVSSLITADCQDNMNCLCFFHRRTCSLMERMTS